MTTVVRLHSTTLNSKEHAPPCHFTRRSCRSHLSGSHEFNPNGDSDYCTDLDRWATSDPTYFLHRTIDDTADSSSSAWVPRPPQRTERKVPGRGCIPPRLSSHPALMSSSYSSLTRPHSSVDRSTRWVIVRCHCCRLYRRLTLPRGFLVWGT